MTDRPPDPQLIPVTTVIHPHEVVDDPLEPDIDPEDDPELPDDDDVDDELDEELHFTAGARV